MEAVDSFNDLVEAQRDAQARLRSQLEAAQQELAAVNASVMPTLERVLAELAELREESKRTLASLRSAAEGLATRQARLAELSMIHAASWASTTIREEDQKAMGAMMSDAWTGKDSDGRPRPTQQEEAARRGD